MTARVAAVVSAREVLDNAMPEAALQAQIIELAEDNDWFVYHHYDSRQSVGKGFPDLVLVRGRRIIFAELKKQSGRPTYEQARWLDRLLFTGCVEVYLWRPSDWPAIEKALGGTLP